MREGANDVNVDVEERTNGKGWENEGDGSEGNIREKEVILIVGGHDSLDKGGWPNPLLGETMRITDGQWKEVWENENKDRDDQRMYNNINKLGLKTIIDGMEANDNLIFFRK